MKSLLLLAALAIGPSTFANSAEELRLSAKLDYAVLDLEAKCLAPRFEDDGHKLHYSAASFQALQPFTGFSTKLLDGRTCGVFGSRKEVSSTAYEKVRVLVYNYGAARADFDQQIANFVKSQN